eukprot:TRINITY_DN10579_c0_g1_i1.p1 TRINITY_DN10579_c0_g1~~TRINITY_DN10579_c0_g1_i1.p1  ORF type:complete len:530 (+),score=130.63 TRINITY_DN10579_c0_g1_i1:120-1709(+)
MNFLSILYFFSVFFIISVFSFNNDVVVATKGDVLINEYLPYSDNKEPWIELYNTRDFDISISEYIIEAIPKGFGSKKIIQIEKDTIIKANGFYVILVPESYIHPIEGQFLFFDPAQQYEDVLDVVSYSRYSDPKKQINLSYYRFPDGQLWSDELHTPSKNLTNNNENIDIASWNPGNFEIHVLDVGQGDSQLIIFPNGFTILIDVNENSWNSKAGAIKVADQILKITGRQHVNVGVISHLHLDHLGYAGYGGFYYLIESLLTFDKIVDRNSGVWKDSNHDGLCEEDEIEFYNVGDISNTGIRWICYFSDPNYKANKIRETADLCSTTQIDTGLKNATVKIITVDGIGATTQDNEKINQNNRNMDTPPSENDYSLGLLIQYGNIKYLTMGDLDGEYGKSSFGYTYNHIEQAVVGRLNEIDIYHVNHHGSSHSSSSELIDVIKPTLSVCSCGLNNSYGHPGQKTIDRLSETGVIYFTSECDSSKDYYDNVHANGNIVIKSVDGKSYTVSSFQKSHTFDAKNSNSIKDLPCP